MATGPAQVQWEVAVGTGALRLAAGTALLRWRDPLIRRAGASPDDVVVRTMFTYFGCRDIAVGIATLAATRPGGNVSRMVALQGAADATDTALISAARATGRFPGWRGVGMSGLAGVTALAGFATAWWLRSR